MPNARWMILAALVATTAATARAQGDPRGDARGDRQPGGRADSVRTLDEQNPIAMVLEHSGDLALTNDQRDRIAAIKQRLNAQQRPLVAQLDSLRPPGPPPRLDPSMSAADRDSLMARRRAVGDVMAQVRDLQQAARTQVWALLTPDQQKKAESLETSMRNDARRGRDGDRPAGGRGRGGMGGMGGGQPPN